nr:cardiomyopathy-associated protein 5-like [Misgurnus anguillicaudatus]XP_055052176.1 cardiomyopathy-associated protein 5-like [Misgurnus anguillicaudatus]XP_055052177.1 cardiomyopathy-associated protein 5-like [Misgurnus anguillicaudatus]XP_055052178.1 cardiomyopathy-associated protein 5-like [Misgurnus anguillicaudatus]XP_055052179.1 cardiomyopathy-associated protein 5-like [Misgurnus anguillicaudatus]XP_055052180.1 cardiomyopathy-associated protein 5-like [Misgurnus anguillicaudatus]
MKPWRKKFKWLSFCCPWQCSNLKRQQYASEVYIQTQAYFSETEIQQGTDAVPSSPDKVAKPLKDHVTPQHQTSLDDFECFTHFPAITLVEPLVIEMTPQHQTSPVEEEELPMWPSFTEKDLTQEQATQQERPPEYCGERKIRKEPLVIKVTPQCQISPVEEVELTLWPSFTEEDLTQAQATKQEIPSERCEERKKPQVNKVTTQRQASPVEEEELALWPSFTEKDLTQAQATEQERPPEHCGKRKKRKKPPVNTVTPQCQILPVEEEELPMWPSFTEKDLTQAQATEQERPPEHCGKRKIRKEPLVNTVTPQCQILPVEEEELTLWPSFTEKDLTQAQATEQERPPGRCEKRKKRKKPPVNTVTPQCQISPVEKEELPMWPSFTEKDLTQEQATQQERPPEHCGERKIRKEPLVIKVTPQCQISPVEKEELPMWPSFTEKDLTQAQATEQERPPEHCGKRKKRKKPPVNTVTPQCQISPVEKEELPMWPSFTEKDLTQEQATQQERPPEHCGERKIRKEPLVIKVTPQCQISPVEKEELPMWPSFTEKDLTQAQATKQEIPSERCGKRKIRKEPLVNTVTPQCQILPVEEEEVTLWPSFTEKDLTQAQVTEQERPSDHCEEKKIRKKPLLITVTPQCQTSPAEDEILPLWPSFTEKDLTQAQATEQERPPGHCEKRKKRKKPPVNTVTPQCQTSPTEDEILPLWPSFTEKDSTQAQATEQERPPGRCEEKKIRKKPLLITVTPQCQTLSDEDKISSLWPSIIVKEPAQVERIVEQRPRKRDGKINISKVPLHQAPHAVVEMLPVKERQGETDHPEVIIQRPLPKLAWMDTGNVPVTQLDDLQVDEKEPAQVERIVEQRPRKRDGKINTSKVPLHQAPHAVVEMLPVQERLGEKNVNQTDHPEVIIQRPLPKLAWMDTGNVPVTQLDDLQVDEKSRPEDQVMRRIKLFVPSYAEETFFQRKKWIPKVDPKHFSVNTLTAWRVSKKRQQKEEELRKQKEKEQIQALHKKYFNDPAMKHLIINKNNRFNKEKNRPTSPCCLPSRFTLLPYLYCK